MPINNILKSSFIILFGAVVGYTSVHFIREPNKHNRQLASMTFSKLGSQQFAKTLFDIKVRNDSIALKANEISTIKVSIEAFKDFPAGLKYTWTLPETVSVVEGDITGDLLDFSAHQKKDFTLKVRGYSKEEKNYISFAINGNLNDKLIERDILVSSRPEDSFEYVVQEMEKSKAAEAQVLNKLGKPAAAKAPIDVNKVSF
jgi:hypothetical protein